MNIRKALEDARVARLATVDATGRPHLVPIVFAFVGNTLVTAVDHKPKSASRLKRLDNITSHPAVSVLVDHYVDDWTQLWWIRLDGVARVVESGPAFDAAVAALSDKYDQYRQMPPEGPVIVIEVETTRSWSAHDSPTDSRSTRVNR